MWVFGNLDIWAFGHAVIWAFIWAFLHLGIRVI